MSGDESSDEYEQAIDLTLTTVASDRRQGVGAVADTERLGAYRQYGGWIAWDA